MARYKQYLIAVLCIMAINAYAESILPIPQKLIKAIHQVEVGGRLGPIRGPHGELGPLQIRYIYWLSSGVKGSFSQCGDYNYSVKVVTAYLNRFGYKAIMKKDYQTLARIHNGGPNGHKNRSTLVYWNRIFKVL
jgi:hypothetical protein